MPYHLAQINLARARGAMTDPVMADFAAALDEINALAERSPGFVWRLKEESGNATSIQAFPDPRILVNLTLWESVEALQHYAYRTPHGKFFARRKEWFEEMPTAHLALWWIPVGTLPTVDDAKTRIASIDAHGPTPQAFTFRQCFPPPAD